MDVNVSKAMAAEHTMSEDSAEAFFAPNTKLSTTPLQEWLFVVGVGGCVSADGGIVEGGRPGNEVLEPHPILEHFHIPLLRVWGVGV